MRALLGGFAALCLFGCDAERDLAASRFACGFGGPCEGSDGGVSDQDGAVSDSGEPPRPACDVDFGSNPCGGDPAGTYKFANACSSRYVFEDLLSCPGVTKRGQHFDFTRDDLSLSTTDLSANCLLTSEESFTIPPSICLDTVGGCNGLGVILIAVHGTCTEIPSSGGCDCTVRTTSGCIDSGPYTTSGPLLTVNSLEYRFCSESALLTYVPADDDQWGRKIVYVTRRVE